MFQKVTGRLQQHRGMELRFDQLDVTLPMGTVVTRLDFKVAEEDPDTFDWTSLLLGTEASANITVPEALVDMAVQMNPQAGMACRLRR